jgi:hypothetical protein
VIRPEVFAALKQFATSEFSSRPVACSFNNEASL